MKIIFIKIIVLILAISESSQAQTLNPVPLPPHSSILRTQLFETDANVVLNNVLLFQNHFQDDYDIHLWRTDGTPAGTFQLGGDIELSGTGLARLNDRVYFTAWDNQAGIETLWRTDGTESGTEPLLDTHLGNSFVKTQGDAVFAYGSRGVLVIADDSAVTEMDLSLSSFRALCALSRNEFFVTTNGGDTLMRLTDGESSEVSLQGFSLTNFPPLRFDGATPACLYGVADPAGNVQYLSLRPNRQDVIVSVPGNPAEQVIANPLGDEPFFFRSAGLYTNDAVYVFDSNTNVFKSAIPGQFIFDTNLSGTLVSVSLTRNFVYARYLIDQANPAATTEVIFDRDFNALYELNNFPSNGLEQSLGHEDLVISSTTPVMLSVFEAGELSESLVTQNIDLFELVTPDSRAMGDGAYIVGIDRTDVSRLTPLFRLDDRPTIQENLNGLWTAPDIPSQGMIIQTGVTENGEYVFASLFSFQDGARTWLAGNVDYLPGNKSVSIPLFEFEGDDFFNDQAASPLGEAVATLGLERTGCNTLAVRIEFADQRQDLDLAMSRLANNRYDRQCRD